MEDAAEFLRTCSEMGIPAALERSRSGRGGHVWRFAAFLGVYSLTVVAPVYILCFWTGRGKQFDQCFKPCGNFEMRIRAVHEEGYLFHFVPGAFHLFEVKRADSEKWSRWRWSAWMIPETQMANKSFPSTKVWDIFFFIRRLESPLTAEKAGRLLNTRTDFVRFGVSGSIRDVQLSGSGEGVMSPRKYWAGAWVRVSTKSQ